MHRLRRLQRGLPVGGNFSGLILLSQDVGGERQPPSAVELFSTPIRAVVSYPQQERSYGGATPKNPLYSTLAD